MSRQGKFDMSKRFCESCPLRLKNTPENECPKALERIYAIQNADKNVDHDTLPGCNFAVNSSAYNYCFFVLAKGLQGSPIPDKEICSLLQITPKQLDQTYKSAIAKLKAIKDTEVMADFREAVAESLHNQNPDNTVYLPSNFISKADEDAKKIDEENQAEDDEAKRIKELEKKKKKIGYGMPMHRSGKKSDIYGIYSKKTLDRIKDEKNGKK
jgi:hypothetical protein